MKATTLRLSGPQDEWVRAECKRLGIGVNELLRRLIDRARGAE